MNIIKVKGRSSKGLFDAETGETELSILLPPGYIAAPDVGGLANIVRNIAGENDAMIPILSKYPPGYQMGEIWIQHKSGITIKIKDGVIELAGNSHSVARVGDTVAVFVPEHGLCTGTITSGSTKVKAG